MEFSISLEGSETLESMARMLGQSPADLMADALRNALSDFVEEYPGVIADYDITVTDSETDAEPVSRPVRTAPVTRTAPSRPARQNVSQSDSDDSGEPVKRQGRPPLKKEADGTRWEASDGGTVTEYGARSVQELKKEGIACRKVGASAWPTWYERAQENDAEPVAKKSSKPSNAPTPNMRVRIPRNK